MMDYLIDDIDRAILTCLAEDARQSLKVLSARVAGSYKHLTLPTSDLV